MFVRTNSLIETNELGVGGNKVSEVSGAFVDADARRVRHRFVNGFRFRTRIHALLYPDPTYMQMSMARASV